MSNLIPTELRLNNGVVIPSLGLGTYRLKDEVNLPQILQAAIDSGYRLIDTAQVYRNETIIGDFLADKFSDPVSPLNREDFFITTKLAPRNQGYDTCYKSICESLLALKVDYIDLFLIHWPGTQGVKRDDGKVNLENRTGSWRAMEQAYREKKLRAIGVSNYTVSHMKELLKICQVFPVLNQVELHPFYPQNDLQLLCSENNILIQAYSSFGEGSLLNPSCEPYQVLTNRIKELVSDVENNLELMPQYLLHWALSKNILVIPKSSSPARVVANFQVLSSPINEKIKDALDQLLADGKLKPVKFCWDPLTIS